MALETSQPAALDRTKRAALFGAFRLAVFITGAGSIIACGVCYGLYRADSQRLRTVARSVIVDANRDAERVTRLMQWVYANHGFRRNPGYFLLARTRATPVQVLERGGDCADKSRLLSAMLRQVDIPATMLMCFDPRTGKPVHTVVEARLAGGEFMVVDPVFDMSFPRPDGRHFGLLDLRENPTLLIERIRALRADRPSPRDPIQAYHENSAVYSRASTINWNRNFGTRFLFALLHPMLGDGVYRLSRPTVVEEPQLSAAAGLALLSGISVLTLAAVEQLGKRFSPERAGKPVVHVTGSRANPISAVAHAGL